MRYFLVLAVAAAAVVGAANAQADDSCVGRCVPGVVEGAPCQCNGDCANFGDCCDDYDPVCLSCEGRCDDPYHEKNECQCNTECPDYGNCCDDFNDHCDGEDPGPGDGEVTNQDLIDLSERLILLDENNMGPLVVVDNGGLTSQCSTSDKAPDNLITSVHDSVWELPTVALFRALFDQFNPDVDEVETAISAAEEAFIDAVLESAVMQESYNFLVEKGVIADDAAAFRATFVEMWFERYDRGAGSGLGSSGFEHVLMGELKGGEVSGFHNWLKYYYEEHVTQTTNYLGYLVVDDFGEYGKGNTGVFTWHGQGKCIGSFFIGTSPELDLSLFTVCFLTRQGQPCNMAFGGNTFKITTYNLIQNGKTHVGTAYPDW